MNKPLLQLWDTVGLGIIIEYPTGVIIANQTGGTACLYSTCEGVYLPLANDYNEKTKEFLSPEIELSNYFQGAKYKGNGAIKGIDLEDVKKINTIINKSGLSELIEIDVERLAASHEAWIRIKINNNENTQLMNGFENYPLNGVLTWANSD
ncbi:DUF6210 family protein [Aquimarina hainanensis]|uniref:DUF6210 family protein n=1 Tax=Aquimarina hainanensis TaxID=1578017 RepID=A0ABW5N9Q0_9FLAO